MCGIFGIINRKKEILNKPLFHVLGINNDTRGGDSCGIFIDGEYEYGIGEEKYYEEFFLKSELLKKTKESVIAIGHCRKASVGEKTIKQAHPIILKSVKDGSIKFVMIHNGTIKNYKELAKKYIPNIKIDDLTDSQVMARIFYYAGYDALAEYEGGSVFFTIDYREEKPLIQMFKGVSKKNDYSKEISDERPFYISMDKDSFVFSSIYSFLPAFRPEIEVETLEDNTLIKLEDGKLIAIKKYDRKDKVQSSYSYKNSYCNDYGYNKKTYKSSNPTIVIESPKKEKSVFTSYSDRSFLNFDENKNLYYFSKSSYSCGSGSVREYPSGRLFIDDYNWASNYKVDDSSTEVYFYEGVALKNRDIYDFLQKLKKKTGLSSSEFFDRYENLIRYLSFDKLYFKNGLLVEATGIFTYHIYSGKISGLFAYYEFIYSDGKFKEKKWAGNNKSKVKEALKSDNIKLEDIKKKLI